MLPELLADEARSALVRRLCAEMRAGSVMLPDEAFVNPSVFTPAEWRLRRAETDSFASRIALQPRIFVIGGDDDLG